MITDRDRRGAQVYATDLSEGLTNLGLASDVVALAPGLHGDLLPIDALGTSERSLATLRQLRLSAPRYDIVVAHGSTTLLACAIGLLGTGVPFIYRQIGDPLFWAPNWSRRLRVAALVRRAAAVVALSPSVATIFRDRYWLATQTIDVIPNAVPGGPFTPAEPSERNRTRTELGVPLTAPIVAYVGALNLDKGVDLALDAIGRIPSAHLVVVGSGADARRFHEQAERVAPGRVHFTGPINQPAEILRAADLLVLPTRGGDSMPAVLIEAGLCGLACVSTPVGAIPDVVIDGATGLIVLADELEPLADAIRTLVDDEALRANYGSAARQRCQQKYTIAATAPAWVQLLERVARHPKKP